VFDTIVSCGEDKKVKIWRKENPKEKYLGKDIEYEFSVPLWKVSWSQVGNLLAVSGGDNEVKVFKENTSG
jgi:protein transport protein SEC13